ncbi:MAG: type II toxin-antitoxin system RelE/ParE family toxin [Oscillospiraceae bacterium]|nr:type II toxin-antitoxin system RelE/ParE family toxin [Oscillospiraceae bacterium]
MKREFVMTPTFDRNWAACGLDDEDLLELQSILLERPDAGEVIPHLSGGRKLRFAASGRGKSGGVRVVYVDVVIRDRIYLLIAYPKNVQENITPEQKKVLNKLIAALKEV